MSGGLPEEIVQFREFARRMAIARGQVENARHTSQSVARMELGVSMTKAIEDEFFRCFEIKRKPHWPAVEAAAMGD